MVPPHSGQAHLTFSLARNFRIPILRIFSRFSIMLIAYLVRYRLSKCFICSQGNSSHEKQNFALVFRKNSHFLILHRARVTDVSTRICLQPGHVFFSLKYAMQMPQFIPQGAMSEILFTDAIVSFFQFAETLFKIRWAKNVNPGDGTFF